MPHSESRSTSGATLPSRSCSAPEGDRVAAYTRDPFSGFLAHPGAGAAIEPGSLLDTPAAHRSFRMIAANLPHSLYTLQVPLSRASGPSCEALGRRITIFSSYSYLGLIGHPRILDAVRRATERYGSSTGGVRLLTGTLELHRELEDELAGFLGQEAAVTFANGYDANLAAIGSLFGPTDVALLDQYAHQSIHDGARLAGCEIRRFAHNDLDDLERQLKSARMQGHDRILVAVDAVFSMDGDQAPLAALVELKDRYGAFLLVDEAHSIGAIGATGRGICEEQGVPPGRIDLHTGSLSKAIPSNGGFVAGTVALKVFLQHSAASYVFSGAPTPPNVAAILEGLRILRDELWRMERLRGNTAVLGRTVRELGLQTGPTASPVVPVLLGDEVRAYTWARRLLDAGVLASPVTYPAVSPGQARLRLCASAAHSEADFQVLRAGLEQCVAAERAGP